MAYRDVIEAIQRNGLDWEDIDRIHLNRDTYDEFQDRASFDMSNYATTEKPAVRLTRGQEEIIYVDDNGIPKTLSLSES